MGLNQLSALNYVLKKKPETNSGNIYYMVFYEITEFLRTALASDEETCIKLSYHGNSDNP